MSNFYHLFLRTAHGKKYWAVQPFTKGMVLIHKPGTWENRRNEMIFTEKDLIECLPNAHKWATKNAMELVISKVE